MERLPAWPGKGRSGKKGHSVMGDIVSLVAKRLGLGLLTLFVVSILIFFAVELLPGDIAEAVLGQSATPETVAALREQMGLNQHIVSSRGHSMLFLANLAWLFQRRPVIHS